MTINKEAKSLGMPWEKEYGYAQAVKVGDIMYVSAAVLATYLSFNPLASCSSCSNPAI